MCCALLFCCMVLFQGRRNNETWKYLRNHAKRITTLWMIGVTTRTQGPHRTRVLLFVSSLCFSLIPLRVIHWPFLDHTRVGFWSLAGLGPSATNQQLIFPLKPEKTGRVLLVFRWPPSAPCARPRSQHQLYAVGRTWREGAAIRMHPHRPRRLSHP